MANFNDSGSRWATVILYRECRMNHFMQEGDRHHTECEEFLGLGEDGQPQETVICSTCRCHRNLHRREDTHILLDRTSIHRVHGLACVPRPPPHAVSPRLQVPKSFCLQESVGEREVSVEVDQERRESRTRYSEAQKVVCAPPPPPPPADVFQRLLLPNMNREEETRRERRARFTEAEKMAMRVYADGLDWSLRGHDKDDMSDFCSGIGITVPKFKAWMRNNKKKYYVPDVETSVGETSDTAGPM